MVNKVRLSDQYSKIEDIASFNYHTNTAHDSHFDSSNILFTGYSLSELDEELRKHKESLDRMSSLDILAFLEARFKIDYLIRCQEKKKDSLSQNFRKIYKTKNIKASLTDDILKVWRNNLPKNKSLIDNFQKALDYRNWLAHGRYWVPKSSPHIIEYDYTSLFKLAGDIMSNINLLED